MCNLWRLFLQRFIQLPDISTPISTSFFSPSGTFFNILYPCYSLRPKHYVSHPYKSLTNRIIQSTPYVAPQPRGLPTKLNWQASREYVNWCGPAHRVLCKIDSIDYSWAACCSLNTAVSIINPNLKSSSTEAKFVCSYRLSAHYLRSKILASLIQLENQIFQYVNS